MAIVSKHPKYTITTRLCSQPHKTNSKNVFQKIIWKWGMGKKCTKPTNWTSSYISITIETPFLRTPPQPKALFLDKNQHDHHNGCKKQTKHKQLKEIAQAKKKTGSNFRECFLVKAKEGNIKSLQSSQLHSAPQSKLEVGRMWWLLCSQGWNSECPWSPSCPLYSSLPPSLLPLPSPFFCFFLLAPKP